MICCVCGNNPCNCPICLPGIDDKNIFYHSLRAESQTKNTDLHWLAMADLTAKKSRCQKRQIGAVVVTGDGRCVSCAYNFHPRGTDLDHVCLRKDIATGTQMDIGYCCHAEINAIIFTSWLDLQGATIYLTQAPCPACAPYIIQAGLANLVYFKDSVERPNGVKIIEELTSTRLQVRCYDR